MANYKIHSTFNLCLALPLLVTGIYYIFHPARDFLLTFIAAFGYSTLFMNPDLDLANKIKLVSIRGFLTLPFRSYSLIFRHRGISHSLFFGSATRILWLTGIGALIFYLLYKTLPSEKALSTLYYSYKYYLFYAFAGICLADWSHLLLDLKKA